MSREEDSKSEEDQVLAGLSDYLEWKERERDWVPVQCKWMDCTRWTSTGFYCPQHAAEVCFLEVKTSSVAGGGDGLWTLKAIQKGVVVCEYAPEAPVEKERNGNLPNSFSVYVQGLPKASYIDGWNPVHGYGRFINDLDYTPTAYSDTRQNVKPVLAGATVQMIATRNIRAGEELSYRYGEEYWKQVHSLVKLRKAIERYLGGEEKQ
jgi:hypothetical protein